MLNLFALLWYYIRLLHDHYNSLYDCQFAWLRDMINDKE